MERNKRMAKKKASRSSKGATKARSKSEVFGEIAQANELTKRQVAGIFDHLSTMIKKDLSRGPGVFTVPGLMKIKVVKKPATKARRGVNPFTGEEMMFKAKPASKRVKVLPLAGLKKMV